MGNFDDEVLAALSLVLTPGVGAATFHKVKAAFGSIGAAFSAGAKGVSAGVPGLGAGVIAAIGQGVRYKAAEGQLEAAHRHQVHIIFVDSPQYPQALQHIPNPPAFIFVRGALPIPGPLLGIVGTRAPTVQGARLAAGFASGLVNKGFGIVSGFAKGVDTAAHQSVLELKGPNVAVMGCGLDFVYPSCNQSLFEALWGQGTLISEYPFGTPPDSVNFPPRNRIISGLSQGVLVVEAGARSGALITATFAGKQGVPVFCVPGSLFEPKSQGTNRLIQKGARLVTRPSDIVQFLNNPDRAPRRLRSRNSGSPSSAKGATSLAASTPGLPSTLSPQERVAPSLPSTLSPQERVAPGLPLTLSSQERVSPGLLSTLSTRERVSPGLLSTLSTREREVAEFIFTGECSYDELCSRVSVSSSGLAGILLNLEIKGLINRKPGNIYIPAQVTSPAGQPLV